MEREENVKDDDNIYMVSTALLQTNWFEMNDAESLAIKEDDFVHCKYFYIHNLKYIKKGGYYR